MKNFQCPYEDISCDKLNTSTNTLDIPCRECEHYHDGIKSTGAMPILEAIINFIKKLFK